MGLRRGAHSTIGVARRPSWAHVLAALCLSASLTIAGVPAGSQASATAITGTSVPIWKNVRSVASGGCSGPFTAGYSVSGPFGCGWNTTTTVNGRPPDTVNHVGLHKGASVSYALTIASGAFRRVTYGTPAGGWRNNASATVTVDDGVPTIVKGSARSGSTASGDLPLWTSPSLGSGSHTITITSEGTSVNVYGLWIAGAKPPPKLNIQTKSLPAAQLDHGYSTQFGATGGDSPYRWSTTSGQLPAGFSLNQRTGEIRGAPTSVGDGSFTVEVRDATGKTETGRFAIRVTPATIFDDTFTGTALSSAWDDVVGSSPFNEEQECYQSSNDAVGGDMLAETADVGSVAANCYCPPGSASKTLCPYASGAVQWSSLGFTYGTVTVRAKLAGGVGTWPAIWLLGTECRNSITADVVGWIGSGVDCPWPAQGANEIDIAEIQPAPIGNPSLVNEAVHTTDESGAEVNEGCGYGLVNSCPANVAGWHTYTLVWAPGSLTWEIDGKSPYTLTKDVPSTPMFLVIDTAVGGTRVTVDTTTLPQTTDISSVVVTGTQSVTG
jgi:hypothetical protein